MVTDLKTEGIPTGKESPRRGKCASNECAGRLFAALRKASCGKGRKEEPGGVLAARSSLLLFIASLLLFRRRFIVTFCDVFRSGKENK